MNNEKMRDALSDAWLESLKDGTQFRDKQEQGLCNEFFIEGFCLGYRANLPQQVAPAEVMTDWKYIANEWADTACNALQWARNISAGISTLAEAEADVKLSFERVRSLVGEPWQPIETAPKGRNLLVGYRNKLGNWRSVIGCYYLPQTLQLEDDRDDLDDDGYAPAGWYEESETQDAILPTDEPPTHWMPLPPVPKEPS